MASRPNQGQDQHRGDTNGGGAYSVPAHSRGTSLSNSSDSGYSGDHALQSEGAGVSMGTVGTGVLSTSTSASVSSVAGARGRGHAGAGPADTPSSSFAGYSLPLHTSSATSMPSVTESALFSTSASGLDDEALLYPIPSDIFLQPLPPSHEWDALLHESLRAQTETW